MTSPMPTVKRPSCEYRLDPLGIDEGAPRLSWALESEGRELVQSAYRVLVARSEEDLESEEDLLWDSGKSNRSVGVEYEDGTRESIATDRYVPPTEGVSEGGRSVEEADDVKLLRAGEGETVVSVGSGRYEFSGRMARG